MGGGQWVSGVAWGDDTLSLGHCIWNIGYCYGKDEMSHSHFKIYSTVQKKPNIELKAHIWLIFWRAQVQGHRNQWQCLYPYISVHDALLQTLGNNSILMMRRGVFVVSTIVIEDWFLKELHRLIKLSTWVKGIDSSTTGFTFCKWTVDANKINADSCNSKMVWVRLESEILVLRYFLLLLARLSEIKFLYCRFIIRAKELAHFEVEERNNETRSTSRALIKKTY